MFVALPPTPVGKWIFPNSDHVSIDYDKRVPIHRLALLSLPCSVVTVTKVGGVGKIEKIIGDKGIKSMEAVLETMREATEDQLVVDRRKKVRYSTWVDDHSLSTFFLFQDQSTDTT
jgi:hypothetical protein